MLSSIFFSSSIFLLFFSFYRLLPFTLWLFFPLVFFPSLLYFLHLLSFSPFFLSIAVFFFFSLFSFSYHCHFLAVYFFSLSPSTSRSLPSSSSSSLNFPSGIILSVSSFFHPIDAFFLSCSFLLFCYFSSTCQTFFFSLSVVRSFFLTL